MNTRDHAEAGGPEATPRRGPPATAEGIAFRCRRCGACCRWEGDVVLEEADIARMALHLGLTGDAFIARHTHLARNRKALSLREQADGSCEFLVADGCAVYDVRPRQCRDFPHTWRVPGCPGLEGAGTHEG